jgi:hypothetical protein
MPGRYKPFDAFLDKAGEENVSAIIALSPREEIGRSTGFGTPDS